MPRGNGTGPNGKGPMSGRAAGYCAGYGMPGYSNNAAGMGRGFGFGYGPRRGMGRGFGFGMGWGACFAPADPLAAPSTNVERRILESQADALEEELKLVRGRLAAIANRPEQPEKTE